MTNAELIAKIKTEIERLKEIHKRTLNGQLKVGCLYALNQVLSFLSTLESEKTISPWKKIHTYTEEIHEGDMEKMLLELSVGKGEKRTKTALPDRIVDILESEKPMNQRGLEREIERCLWQLSDDPSNEELRMFARHFAEWGAEHLKK